MYPTLALTLALALTIATACELPSSQPLSSNITEPFSLQVQNASFPEIHNHFLNLWNWGGGDQHLFVSPAGNSTSELTLVDGVITLPWDPIRRAVINGEVSPSSPTPYKATLSPFIGITNAIL